MSDDDSDGNEASAILRRSIKSKEDKEQNEPVDQYITDVKGKLNKLSSGLAPDTNVENLVSCVTNKYLEKFTTDRMTGGNTDLTNKNSNYDIKGQLKKVEHQIAQQLFNISRVVDDGSFHKILDPGAPT